MSEGSKLSLRVPVGFDLGQVVCSYGYFLLAPNHWDPDTQSLTRPLWLDVGARPAPSNNSRSAKSPQCVWVTLRQPTSQLRADRIELRCDRRLKAQAQTQAKAAVRRMLRLDEDLTAWFANNPAARRDGFGRLFRSPTLFEDMVKTITGCNVAWPNTMRMNRLLCKHLGQGAFPTPDQLARMTPSELKTKTKVGYRADRLIRLARQVARGELDLCWFESPERDSETVFAALRQIHGIGPYAAANVCQHLGFYDQLAIDSETYRHFRAHFDVSADTSDRALHPRIAAHYQQYAPYQFLAYWVELWRDYERKLGPARHWRPETGAAVTSKG